MERERNGRFGGLPLLAALLALVSFYFWTATAGRIPRLGDAGGERYNLLASALLRGQLHLPVEPAAELLQVDEPYRPGPQGHRYGLHDASLYHGRYYLYFGVVPALTAFVPWRLVGLGPLPESIATFLFATGALVFIGLLFRDLVGVHLPRTTGWMQAGCFFVAGLTSVLPFLLRTARTHEVAVSAGCLFAVGAAWFFLRARLAGSSRSRWLFFAGLFLGLAVGCRPNHLLLAPILPLLSWPSSGGGTPRRRLQSVFVVLAPFTVCLVGLGLYNYARFDSWTEFGLRHQIGVLGGWFDYRAVAPTLYYLFLAPPVLRIAFPFVFAHAAGSAWLPDDYFLDPRTTGALAHSPYLLVLLAAPWILAGSSASDPAGLRRRMLTLVVAGIVPPLATGFVFKSATMRFEVDFLPFLVVPALLLWCLLASRVPRRRWRLRGVATLAFGWSLFAALALSLTGRRDDLRRENPSLFAALEAACEPMRVALGRVLDPEGRTVVRLRAAFPARAAAPREVLLSWGHAEIFDALLVSQKDPGRFDITLRTAAGGEATARALRFEPGLFYDFEIDLDRVRRGVVGRVDGNERFRLGGQLVPLSANRIRVGRAPEGAPVRPVFSGALVTAAMMRAARPGLESLPPIRPLPALYTEEAEPVSAAQGQLWVSATVPGARILGPDGWRWVMRDYLDRLVAKRTVTFVKRSLGESEPLLSWGDGRSFNAINVRHLGRDRLALGFAQADEAWRPLAVGPAVAAEYSSKRLLVMSIDRVAGRVQVELDRRVVLDARADLAPLGRAWTRCGAAPDKGPLMTTRFRGRLLPAEAEVVD